MVWTNTGGGDHEGENWTPADALTIGGVHYNVGTFTVTNGYTVNVNATAVLGVYAETIAVVGIINGNGKGYAGGLHQGQDSNGLPGGGGGGGGGGEGWASDSSAGAGGGGAGFGGAGLAGSNGTYTTGGAAGAAYSTTTAYANLMGSGGGAGGSGYHSSALGGDGGAGGGGILLCGNALSVTGTINANGSNGSDGSDNYTGGGGGGSGGGVVLFGNDVTATGTFSCNGATAGAVITSGGASGGGRIKIYYVTSINTSGITTSVTAGGGATVGSYTTQKFHRCTSSISQGQEFTIGTNGISIISQILMYVDSVSTSGDFILKIWDSSSKNTEYCTQTLTISSTGEKTFDFDVWGRLPDGTATYYIELTTAGAGDIDIGVIGDNQFAGGDAYRNGLVAIHTDFYHKVYTLGSGYPIIKSAVVYNTADTTVKSNVTNDVMCGAIHRINSDNTGTIQYTDGFSTPKYLADYTAISGVTHDAGDDELDIADTGYISYTIDTKYIITGMPTLTATIDITAGAPTIQISSNGSTWYDIDTAIVDDVSTEYDLDNAANLSLKGLTTFYLRFDCAGAGTNTCSIKTFTLDVDIVTVDVPNPIINTGTANTFTCDQDADSGLNCEIELIYRDRKWT